MSAPYRGPPPGAGKILYGPTGRVRPVGQPPALSQQNPASSRLIRPSFFLQQAQPRPPSTNPRPTLGTPSFSRPRVQSTPAQRQLSYESSGGFIQQFSHEDASHGQGFDNVGNLTNEVTDASASMDQLWGIALQATNTDVSMKAIQEYHESDLATLENVLQLDTPFKNSGLKWQSGDGTPKAEMFARKSAPKERSVTEASVPGNGYQEGAGPSGTNDHLPQTSGGATRGKEKPKKRKMDSEKPKKSAQRKVEQEKSKKSSKTDVKPKKKELVQCELCLGFVHNVKNHYLNHHRITQNVCMKPQDHDKKEKNYIYQCYHCQEKWQDGIDLKKCRASHGPHKCDHCDVTKKDEFDLYEHLIKKHQIQNIQFNCKLSNCTKVCTSKGLLTQHQIRVHNVGLTKDGERELYPCKTCLQTFKTTRNLEDHEKRAEKNYEFCQAPPQDTDSDDSADDDDKQTSNEGQEESGDETSNDGQEEVMQYSQKSSEGLF